MKNLFYNFTSSTIVIFVLIFSASCQNDRKAVSAKVNMPFQGKGIAVLELFTSQGCSSCPPADELLGKYALQNDERIITLAFHVDYWNRLGWKDSFSTAENTSRQHQYAAWLSTSSVYTPQLVINGNKEMVGSDEPAVENAIDAALEKETTVKIAVKKIDVTGDHLAVQYASSGAGNGSDIIALLVQDKVVTNIKAGENSGTELANYNVVKSFTTAAISSSSSVNIALPKYFDKQQYSLVLFAQEKSDGKINGAVRMHL